MYIEIDHVEEKQNGHLVTRQVREHVTPPSLTNTHAHTSLPVQQSYEDTYVHILSNDIHRQGTCLHVSPRLLGYYLNVIIYCDLYSD